ncbi:MAG: hypothetical protein ACRCVG_03050 [Methanobacteriaceae archaeon]
MNRNKIINIFLLLIGITLIVMAFSEFLTNPRVDTPLTLSLGLIFAIWAIIVYLKKDTLNFIFISSIIIGLGFAWGIFGLYQQGMLTGDFNNYISIITSLFVNIIVLALLNTSLVKFTYN